MSEFWRYLELLFFFLSRQGDIIYFDFFNYKQFLFYQTDHTDYKTFFFGNFNQLYIGRR